jgi:hypothetical protein
MDSMAFTKNLVRITAIGMGLIAVTAAQAQTQDRPVASDNAPQNPALKSPGAIAWGNLSKGHNSFTAAEATSRIEQGGYTYVSHLKLDKHGLWQANAHNNDKPVHVALDYKGNLAER